MQRRNYVPQDDGYNVRGYLEPREGLNEAVRFVYRPVDGEEYAKYMAVLRRVEDTEQNPANFRKRAEIMNARLVEWDMRNHKGKLLQLNTVEIRRLSTDVFWRMFGIILGTAPSDIDPDWNEEEQREEVGLQAEADAQGVNIQHVRQKADEKNSD
jgi:hypothetical protein